MSHKAIFALAVGAGVAVLGYVFWGTLSTRPGPVGPIRSGRPGFLPRGVESAPAPLPEKPRPWARAQPRSDVQGPAGAARGHPSNRLEEHASRQSEGRRRRRRRQADQRALEGANRAAGDESLSREEVGELIAESFALLWPEREFSDEDYAQLTDAVLRVRAARRALREAPVNTGTAEFIERQRRELMEALAQFEVVAGVSPSELPDVINPEGGISPAYEKDEENGSDEARDLLSDYPAKR